MAEKKPGGKPKQSEPPTQVFEEWEESLLAGELICNEVR